MTKAALSQGAYSIRWLTQESSHMSAILITLEQPSPGELLWSLPTLSLQVKSASAASLQGLLRAFYDRPTLSASRALGVGLGELLFTGELGDLPW